MKFSNIPFAMLFACLIATCPIYAAELIPQVEHRQIGFVLSGIAFPNTFAKDLQSGLENRVLIRVMVLPTAPDIRKDIAIGVKYDLWEEVFKVRTSIDNRIDEIVFNRVADVIAYLSNLKIAALFPSYLVLGEGEITLRADILINPIEREKIDRLRQWVAENSAPNSAFQASTNAQPLTSRPNDLFNKIFDQYIRGADIVAPWTATVISKPFVPQRLAPLQ